MLGMTAKCRWMPPCQWLQGQALRLAGMTGWMKMNSRLLLLRVRSCIHTSLHLALAPHSLLSSPVFIGCHRVGVGGASFFRFSSVTFDR